MKDMIKNMTTKKALLSALCAGFLAGVTFIAPGVALASGHAHLDKAPIDISDKASLRRGAKIFAENCYSCHSAKFMRFNRIARDLEMDESEVREMMIFTYNEKGAPTKIGDVMNVAMTPDYAKKAFGAPVPDLSVAARARGADWVYTYLRSFYLDPHRPTGMNNTVFPDVGMPNIFWRQQGLQKAVYKTVEHDGVKTEEIDHLEVVVPGTMSRVEFDMFAADLTNFMVYLAEPVQNERRSLGWKVIGYLLILLVFAYLLKKEYWKDVH